MSKYVFDPAWSEEQRRLGALAGLYDRGTIDHLRRLGVGRGWCCWEVGAGSGTIARWLAGEVGEDGELLVTDLDTGFLEPLAEEGVDVRRHDVMSDPPGEGAFDLVHARALLEHLPGRSQALANMVRTLRPGGWLLAEDLLSRPGLPDADWPAFGRPGEAFRRGFQAAGVDPEYAVRLAPALEDAGLIDVAAEGRAPVMRFGTSDADFLALSLEHLRSTFEAAGLLTSEEADEALGNLRTPGGTSFAPLMVAAWGRRAA